MEFIVEHWAELLSLAVQLGIFKVAWGLYKKYDVRAEARDDAIRSLLRTEIIHICHRADEKGYIEVYNLENLNDMYKAYHVLGGNGAIKVMYEQAQQHPVATQGDNGNA